MDERKFVTYDQIEAVKVSMDEAETTIVRMRRDNYWDVWSSDNTMITKLKRVMKKNPDGITCWEGSRDEQGDLSGYFFQVPKKAVRFGTRAAKPNTNADDKEDEDEEE